MKTKQEIYQIINATENDNKILNSKLKDETIITEYSYLCRQNGDCTIWTDAFQKALQEHEIVQIPSNTEPYYIDNTIIIPSNRRIEAGENAVIKQMDGVKVLMFRNEHTLDGTHYPIDGSNKDRNISINGGIWEEPFNCRAGYGKSGMYDEKRSFFGVSTCMLFNNIENLTITNATFSHAAGFAVQVGDIKNAVFKNIRFKSCYADGLHINGNVQNVLAENISGQVGDDLVALNMYDWQDSSINFGPMENVVCRNLELSQDSRYKAFRIQPGVYYYDDGTSIDCSANNIIIENVKGINTFKFYLQTPPYMIGTAPEKGDVGSADGIYFENIDIDLAEPIDKLLHYMNSDSVRGSFACFELGSEIGTINFENINVKLYKEKWPMSFLVCAGPKSIVYGSKEIFDPYLSSTVQKMNFSNIFVNGTRVKNLDGLIHEISFDNINNDGNSSGSGKIKEVFVK
jgi:hypothetical protein